MSEMLCHQIMPLLDTADVVEITTPDNGLDKAIVQEIHDWGIEVMILCHLGGPLAYAEIYEDDPYTKIRIIEKYKKNSNTPP